MSMKSGRIVPAGFTKTSHEITEAAKFALEDLRTSLRRRDGYAGIAEAAIVEALILAAKKQGVDLDVLDAVLKKRKKLQDDVAKTAQGD